MTDSNTTNSVDSRKTEITTFVLKCMNDLSKAKLKKIDTHGANVYLYDAADGLLSFDVAIGGKRDMKWYARSASLEVDAYHDTGPSIESVSCFLLDNADLLVEGYLLSCEDQ